MLRVRWMIGLLSLGGVVHAADTAATPVLLIVKGNIGVDNDGSKLGLVGGLIAQWANSSVNKQSAARAERFHRAMGGASLTAATAPSFGCFATTAPCSTADVFSDPEKFGEAVKAGPGEGFVVELTPELAPEQLMFRATAHRLRFATDATGTPTRVGNGYVTVYTTRAPAAVAAKIKSDPAVLEAYWAEGTPSRLAAAAQRGLVEIDGLLSRLLREGDETGEWPSGWKNLPKVKEIGKERVACSGPAWCAATRVLEDRGDSFVLVSSGNTAGWFDAAAAAKDANLPAFAMLGIRWN